MLKKFTSVLILVQKDSEGRVLFVFHVYKIAALFGVKLTVKLILHAPDRARTKDRLYMCHNAESFPAAVAV